MAEYQQLYDNINKCASKTSVRRVSDGAIIPFDANNKDMQDYNEWLAEGNRPDPPIELVNLDATVGAATTATSVKVG